VTKIAASPDLKGALKGALKAVNFAVGFALLVMLFPHHGVPSDKPAGVRTAIETAAKKTSLKAIATDVAAAA
jgi:hypothetical protein